MSRFDSESAANGRREILSRVSLTDERGRLNPDAVGWARQPLVDTSAIGGRRAWGRNKRWEYWNISTPTHVVALTVSSLDYAAVHEVWVFDRRSEQSWGKAATVLPSRGVLMPGNLDGGPVAAQASGLTINIENNIENEGHVVRLRAHTAEVSIDAIVERPADHECLAVVVPWSRDRFQYTVKDLAIPASGTLTIEGERIDLPAGKSWAVLDHGRGRWPYNIRWNWGAGSGTFGGRAFGVQVGGKWTDGTGSTENGIFVDGRLFKIAADLRWDYDITDWRRPWRIVGTDLDATFVPTYNKTSRTNLGVIAGRTDQCFGHWSGHFTAGGETTEFAEIFGWAEEVHNRW
jgi:hypothetical protein